MRIPGCKAHITSPINPFPFLLHLKSDSNLPNLEVRMCFITYLAFYFTWHGFCITLYIKSINRTLALDHLTWWPSEFKEFIGWFLFLCHGKGFEISFSTKFGNDPRCPTISTILPKLGKDSSTTSLTFSPLSKANYPFHMFMEVFVQRATSAISHIPTFSAWNIKHVYLHWTLLLETDAQKARHPQSITMWVVIASIISKYVILRGFELWQPQVLKFLQASLHRLYKLVCPQFTSLCINPHKTTTKAL